MQINIACHHADITPAIEGKLRDKLNKAAKHYPALDQVSVWLTVEPKEQSVEIATQYHKTAIAVHAKDLNLYAAIADAAKKFESALAHRDGILKAQNRQKPALEIEPEIEPIEESA